MEKILTVPSPVSETGPVYCTGNEFVSVSEIGANGAVYTAAHLREGSLALIEYHGGPLLALLLDGVPAAGGKHRYVHDFIPEFESENASVRLTRQLFAPSGLRGFVIRAVLTALRPARGTLSLVCRPEEITRTVFRPLPLEARVRLGFDDWSDTVYVEAAAGGGISALAIGMQGGRKYVSGRELRLEQEYSLREGETKEVCFFVSAGCELDGARLANVDMRRRGAALYGQTAAEYDARHIALPDPKLEELANLNLNFCRAFCVGRTLDTGRLVLLTSKSGRYYVSGAYWARDCMLWAFPALLRADRRLAEEALLAACTTYLKEGANHALYLNGVSLYPGFELDQLAAPVIAMKRYGDVAGDSGFLDRPEMAEAMRFTLEALLRRRDADTGLFSTELSPSDDPCAYPFLTYDNYLVLAALRFLDLRLGGLDEVIRSLESGIRRYCVRGGDDGDIFLWSCDGKGGGELYDDPPGSLILIPYYGGCAADDPVWKNTVRHYFSPKNRWFTESGPLFGQGCEHAPQPWPMSLCNLLLARGGSARVYAALAAMEMDNGIACETVWPKDGRVCTGAAFATFAGFYANALAESYGR